MGILGLMPFLAGKFPTVIKPIPSRFNAFEGKVIAMDGNLITSRFWYGSDHHPSRHVRGWYRLVQELRRSSVDIICVFDGPSPSPAKAAEVIRREEARKLYASRAKIEAHRSRRLQKLTFTLEDYDAFKFQPSGDIKEKAFVTLHPRSLSVRAPQPSELSSSNNSTGIRKHLAGLYEDYLTSASSASPVTITDLFFANGAFQVDLPGILALAAAPPIPQVLGHDEDIAVSRMQAYITTEESSVWTSVLDRFNAAPHLSPSRPRSSSVEGPQDSLPRRIRTLSHTSDHLLRSYSRRQEPPNRKVYDDSRTILKAMGVPILIAPFPYEAEGVAASLCAHGLADMVGSEDTDVLVYGAPLIRNLTSRDEPLSQILATDVIQALNLTHSSFVDFALLLGSDFTPRLHGLGPVKALKLIQSEGTIENIIRSQKELPLKARRFLPEPKMSEEVYLKKVAAARQIFTTLPPITEDIITALRNPGALAVDPDSLAETLRGFDLRPESFDEGGGIGNLLDGFYAAQMRERSEGQPGAGV